MPRYEKTGKLPRVIELLIHSDGRMEFYKGKADGSGHRESHAFGSVEEARAKAHTLYEPWAAKGFLYRSEKTEILTWSLHTEPYYAPAPKEAADLEVTNQPNSTAVYESELERNCSEYGVTPSLRYRSFIEQREGEAVDGAEMNLPHYCDPMDVHFSGDELDSFFVEESEVLHSGAYNVDFSKHPGWVPLATIGSEEEQFLCVEATADLCVVAMWEHETESLIPVCESLDLLLETLRQSQ